MADIYIYYHEKRIDEKKRREAEIRNLKAEEQRLAYKRYEKFLALEDSYRLKLQLEGLVLERPAEKEEEAIPDDFPGRFF